MAKPNNSKALEQLHKDLAERESSYRAKALKMYPHVCASCGREFEGKKLKELTVHHKNHDHDHNPPDGSNWELLCIYCHDNEHEKHKMKGFGGNSNADAFKGGSFSMFDGLDSLFPRDKGDENKS